MAWTGQVLTNACDGDQFVTIEPSQTLTEPHSPNLPFRVKPCKYASLLTLGKVGGGLKIRRPERVVGVRVPLPAPFYFYFFRYITVIFRLACAIRVLRQKGQFWCVNLPIPEQPDGCLPIPEIERSSNFLSVQNALDQNRAPARLVTPQSQARRAKVANDTAKLVGSLTSPCRC